MRGLIRVLRVDDEGIALLALPDRPIDVLVDGRRVWTFWTRRDTESGRGPTRLAPWPRPLVRFLDGRCRVDLRDSVDDASYFSAEVALGSGEGRVDVRSDQGIELGIDKSGRLVSTFGDRSEGDIDALLDATSAVISALREAGIEPFLAYGTLLGAVREGQVLPHDSDADLGYVSRHNNPFDVCVESFRLERALRRQGWPVFRYSGAAFKVDVTEGDVTRGLDVFGGFYDSGRLHLLGEVGADYREEWIWPLTTAELHGRPMPVPADPGRLLEAMYGPHWQVPDPAFKFTTPRRTVRALEDWFRGNQVNIRFWERRANYHADRDLGGPSQLARQARRVAAEIGAEVLDVGAGRGTDSLWLAGKGLRVTAYDYVPRAARRAQDAAAAAGSPFEVRGLNLTEWRSVFGEGARLAHDPRPRVVLARHVFDATSHVGRVSLARLCSMALREGGRLLAEVHVPRDGQELPSWVVGDTDVDALTTLLRKAGATRVDVTALPERERPTVRLEGVW